MSLECPIGLSENPRGGGAEKEICSEEMMRRCWRKRCRRTEVDLDDGCEVASIAGPLGARVVMVCGVSGMYY